jgi:hypothetical protein
MLTLSRLKGPLLTAVLMLVMVVVRVQVGSSSELSQGRAALSSGDADAAILHLERAMHWYLPMSPSVAEAGTLLWTLGETAEARGDRTTALDAFQAYRGALFATRSFYMPSADRLPLVNQRIARLQLADPDARWPDRSLSPADREAVALKALQGDHAPHAGWAGLAVVGFLAWVLAAFRFFGVAFDDDGRFLIPQGWRWGLGILAGYAAWVIGLLRA